MRAHAPGADAPLAVGILREGWHTGVVIPVAEAGPGLSALRRWFPNAEYVAFGWGNRAFYTATHPGPGAAIAALLPSRSAMLVEGLPARPKQALPTDARLRWVCASPREVARLDAYLHDYLAPNADGQPTSIAPGSWPDSRFFAAEGTYDAFHTCNTWTLAGLAFAGFPVHAEGVVFSAQVTRRTESLPACPAPRAVGAAWRDASADG